jgi:predicted DCC family thiol-disulfide oxidoreductase YuxK
MSAVVLFDGVCNLCAASVQFIIKRDQKGYFKFASLQSDYAHKFIGQADLNAADASLVLIENGKIYRKSTAAIRIARKLNYAWPLFFIFIIIPPFLRDMIYEWIAGNRYRWFGKKDACMMPTQELKSRFIAI